jgi:hypothetical protein
MNEKTDIFTDLCMQAALWRELESGLTADVWYAGSRNSGPALWSEGQPERDATAIRLPQADNAAEFIAHAKNSNMSVLLERAIAEILTLRAKLSYYRQREKK